MYETTFNMAGDNTTVQSTEQSSNLDMEVESKDKIISDAQSNGTKKKLKARHRASVACASCRDRRIRVCISCPALPSHQENQEKLNDQFSVSFLQEIPNAPNAKDPALNVSSKTMMNDEGKLRKQTSCLPERKRKKH
jgi:hypothetical protein